jgi:hypothetical protein
MANGITYKAKNLEVLAQFFDKLAKNCEDHGKSVQKIKDKHIANAEARAYRDAAGIVRATTLEPDQ